MIGTGDHGLSRTDATFAGAPPYYVSQLRAALFSWNVGLFHGRILQVVRNLHHLRINKRALWLLCTVSFCYSDMPMICTELCRSLMYANIWFHIIRRGGECLIFAKRTLFYFFLVSLYLSIHFTAENSSREPLPTILPLGPLYARKAFIFTIDLLRSNDVSTG